MIDEWVDEMICIISFLVLFLLQCVLLQQGVGVSISFPFYNTSLMGFYSFDRPFAANKSSLHST